MADDENRYLVIVSLGNPSMNRLTTLVPRFQDVLKDLSTGSIEQTFRSTNADVFSYFLRSKLAAGQIRAAIETPQRGSLATSSIIKPLLEGDDHVLVVEVGEDFSGGRGFNRQQTWLQRH